MDILSEYCFIKFVSNWNIKSRSFKAKIKTTATAKQTNYIHYFSSHTFESTSKEISFFSQKSLIFFNA